MWLLLFWREKVKPPLEPADKTKAAEAPEKFLAATDENGEATKFPTHLFWITKPIDYEKNQSPEQGSKTA